MEIRNVLVLSTSHVKEETAKLLDRPETYSRDVAGGSFSEYGWFMYAQEDTLIADLPADLTDVMDYARGENCEYILFDRDAEVIEDLPTWEW